MLGLTDSPMRPLLHPMKLTLNGTFLVMFITLVLAIHKEGRFEQVLSFTYNHFLHYFRDAIARRKSMF